ncbi:MAG: 2-amino-4-hydroxy-6-hydroxymethyldihydropteridine diphosphokinase [Cycloclasticus sp.]|nr:2-amino-4-hydroxy-6-hydroxymethyldihydropteridine diphosphokinase [Cycloclasticus sp.]
MPATVFIGLGSNLQDPVQQVLSAVEALKTLDHTHVDAISRLYETSPMGPQDQPNYINAVAKINTKLQPYDLLEKLHGIEAAHDRTRDTGRWGARTLDLDILLYADLVLTEPKLTLPHSGLHERAFVLYPLADIDDSLIIPTLGTVQQLIQQSGEPEPSIIEGKNLEIHPSVC